MFFQLIFDGFVVFVINTILGSLLFLLLRSHIQNRIEEWLQSTLSGYIRTQLEYTLQHPEETARTLAPVINAIIREVAKDFQKTQNENVVKIPFIGKLPAPLVQMFLERFLGGSKQNEGNNPFA